MAVTAACTRRALRGALLACVAAAGAASAQAATPKAVWQVKGIAAPSIFPPQSPTRTTECETHSSACDTYYILVENTGGAASEGEVTIADELPAGATLVALEGEPQEAASCETSTEPVELTCKYSGAVVPGGWLVMKVKVSVPPGFTGTLTDKASVAGGGAPPAEAQVGAQVGEQLPSFGISDFAFEALGPAGEPDPQAGDHPEQVTVTTLTPSVLDSRGGGMALPVESIKDLVFYLPLGFLGNPQVTQRCPAPLVGGNGGSESACPSSDQVGSIEVFDFGGIDAPLHTPTHVFSIYNVEPEQGYPAEFAFPDNGLVITMYASVVRHEGAYMLRIAVPGVPRVAQLVGAIATFFGNVREKYTVEGEEETRNVGAFLTNPTDCAAEPLSAAVEADTWEAPERWLTRSATAYPQLIGCELLGFAPTLASAPETTQADEPSGYEIHVSVPQAPNTFPDLGTPPLHDVTIALPPGTALSPAAAAGLGACQPTGPEGIDIEGPESEAVGVEGLPHPVPGHCPGSSQLGSVQITSPLLAEKLAGHLFLAAPRCGGAGQSPCTEADAQNGTLFSLYLEAEAPREGVNIKLAGVASVNPGTGQVTTTFTGNPQFPVSDLVVRLNGGPLAPLANPQSCGTATTTSEILPWSAPVTPAATPASSFAVDWDGHGEACPGTPPFAPSFNAGTTDPAAGAYSPFALTLTREDREQDLASITTQLPPGLLAAVSKVEECPEPQAASGSCPAASQIGTATVGVGAGSHPYYVQGQVYFTGPYGGAPFGLTVAVPAVAGPFNLGEVVVRAALYIDPHDAHVTAVSAPFPQMLDGVPLRVRTVAVTLNRPDFTFNPTSCTQQAITATIASAQGATAGVSSPFAVAGCRDLPFSPTFAVSTAGHTSRADGASLRVEVTYKPGQANIRKVAVDLPKQLPSRLSTLKQACPAEVFETNPAVCPAGSMVGSAIAHTPVLKSPLAGPAYLVSHASLAFPDLVIVLQGEGVTLDLVGHTLITNGITSSTFETVPDAPVGTFELDLPEGPHSALGTNLPAAAKRSLCAATLTMPTTLVGQNGAQVQQNTRLSVTGCRGGSGGRDRCSSQPSIGRSRVDVHTKDHRRSRVRGRSGVCRPRVRAGRGGARRTVRGLQRVSHRSHRS
jgi:hypothetical protein